MAFFRRHKGKGSYDLFSNYTHCLPGYGGMVMLFVMFLIGAVLASMISALLQLCFSPEFAVRYGTMITYPVQFIPALIYASLKSRMANVFDTGYALDSNHFGKLGGFGMALVAIAATLACAFVTEPVSLLLPAMPEWLEKMMDQMMDGPVWITLVSVSIFAPLFEEWLCRGLVLRGLLKNTNPTAAISVSAAFFAVLHMNPWQAIPAFILGLLFGYVYYRTGSLRLTMLMHCANNSLAVIVSRIPSFKDAETFMDVLSPWAYACVFIASLAFLAGALITLKNIQVPTPAEGKPDMGNCEEIPPVDVL